MKPATTELARPALAFGVTRVANGLIALIATFVPIALVGTAHAGEYFALWTAAWICGVVARFGADAVLPRLVAERPDADGLALVRGRWMAGAGCAVVMAPAACAALGVALSAQAVVLVLATALVWGRTFVIAGVLRARSHVVASGIATNVVWSVAGVLGPLAAAAVSAQPSPTGLLVGTFVLSIVALAVARAMLWRLSPPAAERGAPVGRGLWARRGGEVVGAAAIGTAYEVAVWSPMIYAGLAGLSPAQTAAIFAATRLAGVASWGYQAVVATTGPHLARAIVAGDAIGLRALVRRGGRLGLLATLPVVVVGTLAALPATELLLGVASASAADALRVLLLARLVDAATGPLSEAFVVGRRVWLDVGLFGGPLVAGAVVVGASDPSVFGVAVVAAAASIATNVVRAGLFNPLLVTPTARKALA